MPPIDATSYDFINLADNALYQQKAGKTVPISKPAFRIIIIISELLNITVTDSHQLTAICYFLFLTFKNL